MRTRRSKAQTQQRSNNNLAEEALGIAVENMDLNQAMIKALRLTCKRTKVAADARVQIFTLFLDQEPEAVERSGLLNNIIGLQILFVIMASGDGSVSTSQILSRALALLNVAVNACSRSLEGLKVNISASTDEAMHACGCVLGNSSWPCLKDLSIVKFCPFPNIVPGLLEAPGNFLALKQFHGDNLSAPEIEVLHNSAVLTNLTYISMDFGAYESHWQPASMTAMRNLLQKATNLKILKLVSGTFEFFDSENLVSLKKLHLLDTKGLSSNADFAPVLARPWPLLESLTFDAAHLQSSDVLRIFEADDTLPAMKRIILLSCTFDVDMLGSVRRPHLEELVIAECTNSHILFSKMAQSMQADPHALPKLRELSFQWKSRDPIGATTKAFSKLLSCPCMAGLEDIGVHFATMGTRVLLSGTTTCLLHLVATHCPKLKMLDLRGNGFKRPAIAVLVGFGVTGAWPELETLHILDQGMPDDMALDSLDDDEQTFIPKLDSQTLLRRAWPGLECF